MQSPEYSEMLERYLGQKLHPIDIANRLGMHVNALRRVLPKGYSHKPREALAYGITDKSYAFRIYLADILISLEMEGRSPTEISMLTGLNKHERYRASNAPFEHDWTLSQIERTLRIKYDNT